MNHSSPLYIDILFLLTLACTVMMLYKAARRSSAVLLTMLIWLCLQSALALLNFYTVTDTFPPRFVLLVLPPLLFMIFLFATDRGRRFIDSMDVQTLTYLHTIRIPVEIILLLLSFYHFVPQLMTWEGKNFDILSGISAPVVAYLGFTKKILSKKLILAWNIICLLLLFNVVFHGILSAPSPFQKFSFENPNQLPLYFPFMLLPAFIVPVVLFSHLASIRILLYGRPK
ncbi:MAG: hypothetical protein Q8L88_11475 [Bacteroidota bacterium]|nr:hypothetical protein [Bacteroidota bacterium]